MALSLLMVVFYLKVWAIFLSFFSSSSFFFMLFSMGLFMLFGIFSHALLAWIFSLFFFSVAHTLFWHMKTFERDTHVI